MFGDLSEMMGKLKQAREQIENTKKRLDTILVDGQSAEGRIKIAVTANREIKSIVIDDSLLEDKEELEDYLIIALNKALEKATTVHETEMAAAAKNGLPNIPGLDMF